MPVTQVPAVGSPAALTVALLLGDARLPAGGHAHSGGVEPALMGGLDVAEAEDFIRARVASTTLVEVGTAVVARLQLATATSVDHALAAVGGTEQEWLARTPAPALREASRLLARGLLRVATVFRALPHTAEVIRQWRARPVPPPRALVTGLIGATSGLSALELGRVIVYDEVQAAAAAVLKLEPTDPVSLTAMVVRCCAAAEPHLAEVAAATQASQIPAFSAPQFESWAQAHAHSSRRLFRA